MLRVCRSSVAVAVSVAAGGCASPCLGRAARRRARRAWLAVAPSNAMRAACGELAVALLIVAMKTYRKHVLGRAMIPRLWRMGGRQRLHSNDCLNFSFSRFVGAPAVAEYREAFEGGSKVSGLLKLPRPQRSRAFTRLRYSRHRLTVRDKSLCHPTVARFAACSERE